MTACVDTCSMRAHDKCETPVAATVVTDAFLDDVRRANTTLVMAQMRSSFASRKVRNMVVTFSDSKSQVRNLNVCLCVRVRNWRIAVLNHACVDPACQCRISFTIGVVHDSTKTAFPKWRGFIAGDTHDSGFRIHTTLLRLLFVFGHI